MAEFEGKFGSNRAGTWVENGIGSNRTKKPGSASQKLKQKPILLQIKNEADQKRRVINGRKYSNSHKHS